MMKYAFLPLFLLLVIALYSCQDTTEPEPQSNFSETPDFLFIANEDPLNIETDAAFLIDGAGPMYFSVLNLTDEQKEQIKEIVGNFREEFAGLHGRWRGGTSWEDIREERKALHEKIREAIYEILTEEQKAILNDIKTQLENGQYPDILVEHRVAYLNETLDLSSDQQTELTNLFKEYGAILLASRDSSENRFEFIIAKLELLMELDRKIRDLLTDEQSVLYNEIKQEQRRRHIRHHWR